MSLFQVVQVKKRRKIMAPMKTCRELILKSLKNPNFLRQCIHVQYFSGDENAEHEDFPTK